MRIVGEYILEVIYTGKEMVKTRKFIDIIILDR